MIALDSSKSNYREILDCTLGAVFLGTPHSTRAEDIIKVLQYARFAEGIRVESDVPELLRQSVSSLQAIQQTFEELHLQKLLNIQVSSFFEELAIPGFGLVIECTPPKLGISDTVQVVDEAPAVLQQFSCIPLYANHQVKRVLIWSSET